MLLNAVLGVEERLNLQGENQGFFLLKRTIRVLYAAQICGKLIKGTPFNVLCAVLSSNLN